MKIECEWLDIYMWVDEESDVMACLLIVEDDVDLGEGIGFAFSADGYVTRLASCIREGRRMLDDGGVDCVILDCNLPDGNGFEFCREIRAGSDVPILMLTARDTELDEVKALELGVDDFMTKPFSVAVLKARVKRLVLRRNGGTVIQSNGIRVDVKECRVFREGEEVVLSKVEYKLLLFFLENRNQVLSKEQILENVWDSAGRFVDENTVSVNIRRLRAKVEENPDSPCCIKTVHGLGYIWKEQ